MFIDHLSQLVDVEKVDGSAVIPKFDNKSFFELIAKFWVVKYRESVSK